MRSVIVFLLTIYTCSCGIERTNDSADAKKILVIDLLSKPASEITKLSEIAEDIEYIPLQTTPGSLIGPFILKIIKRDDRIYLRNSGLDGEILCFSIGGKFLYKISNIGRGPEEYTSATDFDVSSDNKTLFVLSPANHKLVLYDITNTGFTFQKSVSLKNPVPYKFGIVPGTNNALLAIPPWMGNEPALSVLINTAGNTLWMKPNCYKFVKKTGTIASSEMLVYSIPDMVCFKEEFSDTVFYVDARSASSYPRMIINTHGTLATSAMRGGTEIPGRDATRIDYIFETTRYVFFWYLTTESLNGILFDRKTEKKYNLNKINPNDDLQSQLQKQGLKDDLSGGPDVKIEFRNNYISDGKIFSTVETMTLKKYVAGADFKNAKVRYTEKKKALEKLVASLKETDNPVLVLVRLKK